MYFHVFTVPSKKIVSGEILPEKSPDTRVYAREVDRAISGTQIFVPAYIRNIRMYSQ